MNTIQQNAISSARRLLNLVLVAMIPLGWAASRYGPQSTLIVAGASILAIAGAVIAFKMARSSDDCTDGDNKSQLQPIPSVVANSTSDDSEEARQWHGDVSKSPQLASSGDIYRRRYAEILELIERRLDPTLDDAMRLLVTSSLTRASCHHTYWTSNFLLDNHKIYRGLFQRFSSERGAIEQASSVDIKPNDPNNYTVNIGEVKIVMRDGVADISINAKCDKKETETSTHNRLHYTTLEDMQETIN